MSHVVSIQTQIRDAAAVAAACHRLGLPPPVHRKVTLFSGTATGLAVELPGWHYPLVCELASGQLHYDDYGGAWGNPAELARFRQMYAVEKAKLEAHKKGCTEQCLTDGSIRPLPDVPAGNRRSPDLGFWPFRALKFSSLFGAHFSEVQQPQTVAKTPRAQVERWLSALAQGSSFRSWL